MSLPVSWQKWIEYCLFFWVFVQGSTDCLVCGPLVNYSIFSVLLWSVDRFGFVDPCICVYLTVIALGVFWFFKIRQGQFFLDLEKSYWNKFRENNCKISYYEELIRRNIIRTVSQIINVYTFECSWCALSSFKHFACERDPHVHEKFRIKHVPKTHSNFKLRGIRPKGSLQSKTIIGAFKM